MERLSDAEWNALQKQKASVSSGGGDGDGLDDIECYESGAGRELPPESATCRDVTQYQFTGWPDHDVPQSAEGFNALVRFADEFNVSKAPLLVHCSAGVGRTGTFCTVSYETSAVALFPPFFRF